MNRQAVGDCLNILMVLETNGAKTPTQLFHRGREEFILWCRLCRDVGEPARYWKLCGSIAGCLQEDVGMYLQSLLSLGECIHPYMSIAYLDRGANTVSLFQYEEQPVHTSGSAGQLLQLVGVRPIETKLSTVLECGEFSGAGEGKTR